MKPVAFDYRRARDLAEAVDLLARFANAKILAGAQSLGPLLNLRLARPELLIDISCIGELKRIEETDRFWRIGAGVTHAQLEDARGRLIGAKLVSDVAAGIAYRSVRNLGTIGGSLAHADPAADWPLALAALGASVIARGSGGRSRRITADSFVVAPFTTVLERDEVVTAIEVPKRPPGTRYGYFKFCRKVGEFPESSAAVVLNGGSGRIMIGCLNGPPALLPELTAEVVRAGSASDETCMLAVAKAVPEMTEIAVHMHAATVRRAIQQACLQ